MEFKKLTELIEDSWGEDQEDSEGYARIIIENTKPEYHERIIKEDLFFNRYNSVTSYEELASAILSDGWEDNDVDEYLQEIQQALDGKTIETLLRNDGWRINTEYGGAIGLDYEVLKPLPELQYHLIRFQVTIGEYELHLTRVIPMYDEDSSKIAHEYLMNYWGEENTRCEETNKTYFAWSDEVGLKQLAAHAITKEEYDVLNKYLY